jgi:predicted dehydrogenase
MKPEENSTPESTSKVSRRKFLHQSLAAGGALAFPLVVPGRVLGLNGAVAPNSKIILGAIGIQSRGRGVLGAMMNDPGVQMVAICDIQRKQREAIKNMADQKYGTKDCAMYRDLRELLARPDIDAVLIATGDRWHSLGSIYAARAGKDVYAEKPVGTCFSEVQGVDDNVRRYGRIFQVGTQRRSIANFQTAVNLAQSGKLGKIHTLHAGIIRPSGGRQWLPEQPQPPADEVDWDLWLGGAPWRPYNAGYVAGGWRGHDDFDSGYGVNEWGSHTVDLCQWAIGADNTAPVEYEAFDDRIECRYANGVKLVLDFLKQPFGDLTPHYTPTIGTCPVRYEGTEGWVETADSGNIEVSSPSLKNEILSARRAGTDPATHTANFFQCIRSRSLTNANSSIMRKSHLACHGAAIAWKLGRKLRLDPDKEQFINDDEANRLLSRPLREPWKI